MYKLIIRPLFFLFDPEKIHNIVFWCLKIVQRIPVLSVMIQKKYVFQNTKLEKELFGIRFPNPVGLAAGFDKDAEVVDAFANFGFGFLEIGTLTPKPQPGNHKKRLFRLPQDKALINRMGFNNDGVEAAVKRLKKRRSKIIIAGNIGKNKVTPNKEAVSDYLTAYEALYEVVDFFVVNVSSPNTPNLRSLQEKEPLTHLLNSLQEANQKKATPKPILLKIAPDLSDEQLLEIIDIVKESHTAGIIATNTTISRGGLTTDPEKVDAIGAGGLSGQPLKERSTEVIRFLAKHVKGAFPIIGVGGIHSPQDAKEKLEAGADLIQLYTGFVYEGPGLIKRILKELV